MSMNPCQFGSKCQCSKNTYGINTSNIIVADAEKRRLTELRRRTRIRSNAFIVTFHKNAQFHSAVARPQ